MSTVNSGTRISSIAVLIKTMVGGGILSLPFAFASCGWVVAMSLLAIVATMYERTIVMQIFAADFVASHHVANGKVHGADEYQSLLTNGGGGMQVSPEMARQSNSSIFGGATSPDVKIKTPLKTYEEVAGSLLGPRWALYVQIAKMLLSYGACVSYLVAVGDFLYDVINETYEVDLSRMEIIWIFSAGISLPLSCLPYMHHLRYSSMVAIGALIYVSLAIVVLAIDGKKENDGATDGLIWPIGKLSAFEFSLDTLRSIPVFFFAYGCQMSTITLYNELKYKTDMSFVVRFTMLFAISIYSCIGIAAASDFGDSIESNVLNSYGNGTTVTIGRIVFAFALLFTYPIVAFSARETVWNWWHPTNAIDIATPGYRYPWTYYSISVIFYLLVVIPASLTDNLSTVFGLTGATAGAALYAFFPTVMYLRVMTMSHSNNLNLTFPAPKILAQIILVATVIIGITASITILLQDVGVL